MDATDLRFLRDHGVHDEDLILRRYLTWPKLESLVKEGLFFPPASRFSDRSEGHYTAADLSAWDRQLARWGSSKLERTIASKAKEIVAQSNLKTVVISCWTSGYDEDPRMWEKYGGSEACAAVETTVRRLKQVLGASFLLIPVEYIDFEGESIPKDHSLHPFFYKRACFAWEREVRVVGEMEIGAKLDTPRVVPIDLGLLMRRVIASPGVDDSFLEAVTELVAGASSNTPVERSSLETRT